MKKKLFYHTIEKIFKDDLDLMSEMLSFTGRIRSKEFDSELINAIVMKRKSDDLNIYDAYVIYKILNFIEQDLILYKKIFIGEGPHKDKCRDENNAILSKLPSEFEAEFYPSSGASFYNDGYFKVRDGNIEFELKQSRDKFSVPELSVPLEVGTTESYTSFNHISFEGGLARWPYGSEYIHLFYRNYQRQSNYERYIKSRSNNNEKK
ncbi:hypothetical protein AAGS61_04190 [Lysinibacillus sp. KU-BSD001]|uniref:hypothetical protein n=1 Tax=Lysinibacillus sp. KU-BSD001 TaxID=3141328 RepID=UPI0036E86F16